MSEDKATGAATLRQRIEDLRSAIAQHCASFFWNDIDIGLLHAEWRDALDDLLAQERETPDDDCGLSIDTLDVDRLKSWANLIEIHGADITHWGQVAFVVSKLREIADRIEVAVRDIGRLRAAAQAQEPSAELKAAFKGLATSRQPVSGCVICAELDDFCDECKGIAAQAQERAEPQIACPACGEVIRQVASATLDLALWQHYQLVCERKGR